ncbi:homoserine dehydrogenase [Desulfitobacterium dichloroeliminans LMG P-21439]|uniref:Homoserine dehydrogenase n=1 Tax=Desulfitobacterium dichloroeliminans (strain LMG P-21439 / DCA1) TaxID=871963 RepID=L0F7E7_DESDL|nr:homoserine dehydrogenase [Desulfitobacterium dichloroeliminans]AGA69102.1 homoserine dehydrogenase [Desulfitobacterium dichloroeliminans LMG P-21439]
MQEVSIGLLGLGTVGSGVIQILQQNASDIQNRCQTRIKVSKVLVRNLNAPRNIQGDFTLTDQVEDILADPQIHVVVEAMGGIEPARTYILEAFKNGKNVVTANKDLLAIHGHELLDAAKEAGKDLLFEASVAGGIPIIAALKQSLAGNKITEVLGIINGTTNYILTAMTEQGRDYQEVLEEAQMLGYAEADPSADVDGLDAARKLAILSSIAFNSRVTVNDVYVEGISKITAEDIAYARELDSTIKLLAVAKSQADGIEVRVHPAILPNTHPLASVNGVFNAIYLVGDAVGETMFYGRGAGSLPTGSAVVSDIIQVVRNLNTHSTANINCTCYNELPIKSEQDFKSAFYIRLRVKDEPRVLATLALLFAEASVSFASIIQKQKKRHEAEIVLVTHPSQESQLREALDSVRAYGKVLSIQNVIRFESGELNDE